MAWMETDYSKPMYFRWKIKWRLENFGALGIMGEMWNVWGHLTLFWVNPTKARSGRKSWDIELCSYLLQVTNRWLKIECWSCPVEQSPTPQLSLTHLNHWPTDPLTQNENVCPDNRFDMSDKVQYSKFKLQCRFFDVGLPTMWSEFACPANQNPKRTIKKRKPRYLCAPLKFFKCVRHVW